MTTLFRTILLLTLSAFPAAAISVSGTLTTDGGAPMVGATVTVEQVGGEIPPFTLTTGANGAYSVTDPLLFGNIRITPAKSGFRFDPPVIEAFTDINLANRNFTGISLGQIAVQAAPSALDLPQAASVGFPQGAVDEETTMELTIRNSGTGPLTGISLSFSGVNAADFSVVTTLPSTLLSQGVNSAPLIIAARPSAPGSRTAILNIYSSDSKENPFVISLSIEAWPSVRVSSLADSGPGSLREAFANAAAKPGADTLILEPNMAGGVVSLNSEIQVNDPAGVSLQSSFVSSPEVTTFDQSSGGWQSGSNTPFDGVWKYRPESGSWRTAGQPDTLGASEFRTTSLTGPIREVVHTGEQFLRFRHRYSFEQTGSFYDGGQLLISVDGGPFQQVTAFVQNGYSGTVTSISSAQIRGQSAFCGRSPGFYDGVMTESLALLGNLNAGQQVRIQFLAAFDGSLRPDDPAWEIDSVTLESRNLYAAGLTIRGQGGLNRLLSNLAGSRLSLSGITLTEGKGGGMGDNGPGGAVFNAGILSLFACTLYGNSSSGTGDGGAIFNAPGGMLSLDRCTLAENTSPGGRGGAIASASMAPITLTHCTVAGNTAWLDGGGISEEGGMFLINSIVAENRVTGFGPNDVRAGGSVALTGPNIVRVIRSDPGVVTGGVLLDTDPRLSPLAACGGPTLTMALVPGSPARDAVTIASNGLDQRGFVMNGLPDIGAYEANATVSNFNAYIRERVPAGSPSGLYAPDADFDFDGQSNEQEWLALTDPTAPESNFNLSSLVLGGSMSLRFQAHPARVYTLQQSDTLAPGSWIPAPGVTPIEAGSGLHAFVVPVSAARRFYRVAPSLPQ